MNTKTIGEISEAKALAKLLDMGWSVSLPFGNNQRYDMIVDNGDELLKIQVKTAWSVDGGITFKTSSVNGFTGARTTYHGQIDYFVVVYEDEVYMVPVDECGVSSMLLRKTERAHRGGPTVRWAKDYLLSNNNYKVVAEWSSQVSSPVS